MNIAGFAFNADAGQIDGNLETLRSVLDLYRRSGISYVEISPHGAGVICGGRIIAERMAALRKLLGAYPFRYTVHGPNPSNLMNLRQPELEKEVFKSSLRFAHELEARVMVYHAGRYIPEEDFLCPGLRQPDEARQKEMWESEKEALQEMGDLAATLGVTIGVENARPYPEFSGYCYGVSLSKLARMVREVNHSHVAITLDCGHAYLASCFHSEDLLAGVREVAERVAHIHLHDNFGRPSYSYERKVYENFCMGRGDMHMPIGWGAVPAREIFAQLPAGLSPWNCARAIRPIWRKPRPARLPCLSANNSSIINTITKYLSLVLILQQYTPGKIISDNQFVK